MSSTWAGGFRPWRRDVLWLSAADAPIRPLVGRLAFTGEANWGGKLRFGLLRIGDGDLQAIAAAMQAELPPASVG